MGIGFVLFFWALILGVMAVAGAVILGLWSWWNQRREGGRGVRKPAAAAALPFILLGYGGVAFTGFAIWCEVIRDVDLGIGDSWRVPVGNDHYFCMIDVPDEGYLFKGGCTGAPIVDGIRELAAAGDLIVGTSESSGPFVFDTRTSGMQTFPNVNAALATTTPRPALKSAGEFYTDRRWPADAIAALLIALPALAAAFLWYAWFIRAPRRRAVPTPSGGGA